MSGLTLKNIKKYYDKTVVIPDLSLEIHSGEFLVLVGPSGCGKSTLLRMIAGLDALSDGTIHIEKTDVTDLPAGKRGLSMVFQSYALYPHMTVRQNLAFGLKNIRTPPEEIARRISEAALILRLDDMLDRLPQNLSGGQRQRVAIGRSIVQQPKVFLFDEPLSNLDAALRVQMRQEISQLHARLKNTMIYVTHDQVEAMTLAQRVMVMNKGIAEQIGTPVEVYEKPASRFVASFIGSPAMNLLEGCISHAGTHFELESGMALPINWYYRGYAGRKMTLGIRPEHIALSSQADGGVPLVMDTLEMLGADNLAHGRWGDQKMVVRLAHQERPKAGSTLWLHLPENHLHLFDGETGQRV